MEALVIVVLALLLAPLISLLCLAVETSLFVLGLASLFFRKRVTSSLRLRRVGFGFVGTLALGGVFIVLLNTVLFESTLRYALGRLRTKTGIEVTFAKASGNLLTGKITLTGARALRRDHPSSVFDLAIEEARLRIDTTDLFSGLRRLESLHLSGLQGAYLKILPAEERPRKDLVIEHLLIERASVRWEVKREGEVILAVPLTLERLECRGWRSRWAAFDVLFSSTAKGTIAGGPVEIAAQEGRSTWTGRSIPVTALSAGLGAPFDWIAEGALDVDVANVRRPAQPSTLDMRWSLVFRDLRAEVPERITGLKRTLAEATVNFLNRNPKRIPLELNLTVDERHFEGSMSIEAMELWAAVAEGITEKLAEKSGLPRETLKRVSRSALDKFRQYLEKKRPPSNP